MIVPNGHDWHVHTMAAINACLGQLASCVRLVRLLFRGDRWILEITLDAEDGKSLKLVEEIFEDYALASEQLVDAWEMYGDAAFSEAAMFPSEIELKISKEPLKAVTAEQTRYIYLRRET